MVAFLFIRFEEVVMNKLTELLDINEVLLEDVNESISLTWSGDSKWSDKWTKAVQVKYKDEIGKFVKELSIKLDGNPYWILVFQNASIIGRTVEDGTGSLEYFCQGQADSVLGTKKIDTFKSDGMVMGKSKGGIHFIKIPEKVFSMKQLMEWWKKIHASYEAEGQVDTPQAMSMSGTKDFNQILKDIQGYLSGPSWKSNIPYEIGFGSSSNVFLVLLDSTPVIKFLKGTGDLLRLDTSAVKSRGVVTPSIATGEILGMMEDQLGVKAQTTASTSASRINQMVDGKGTPENPDVNMMRNPFDDRW